MPLRNEQAQSSDSAFGDRLMYVTGLTNTSGSTGVMARFPVGSDVDILEIGIMVATLTVSGGSALARIVSKDPSLSASPLVLSGGPVTIAESGTVNADNQRNVKLLAPGTARVRSDQFSNRTFGQVSSGSGKALTHLILALVIGATVSSNTNCTVWCRYRTYDNLAS